MLQGVPEVNHILDDVPEDASSSDEEVTTEQLIAEKHQVRFPDLNWDV